jgi:hypothetical protein
MAGIKFTFKNFGPKEFLESSFAPHAIRNGNDGIVLGWTHGLPFFNQGKKQGCKFSCIFTGKDRYRGEHPMFQCIGVLSDAPSFLKSI